MKLINTSLQDAFIIRPKLFEDSRGLFFEAWNKENFNRETNLNISFVQENQSISRFGVLRGLHYQLKNPQGKLVRTIEGCILDVAIDIRIGSPKFGHYVMVELSSRNKNMLYIHNFQTSFSYQKQDLIVLLTLISICSNKEKSNCLRLSSFGGESMKK